MKTNIRFWLKASAVTIATLVALSGCGSDSNSNGVQPVASSGPGATGASFIAFIQALPQGDETSQPVTVNPTYAAPPEDNTGNPAPVL
jgi:hypothetical protein